MKPIGYYNEAHGFLHDEFDKDCYCQGGCSMETVYTESQVKKLTGENKAEKLQEQLDTTKKALTEEIESIEKYLDKYGMSSYGANTRQAYLEGLKKALAAIGGDDE